MSLTFRTPGIWRRARLAPGAIYQSRNLSDGGWTVQRATLAPHQVRGPDGKTSAAVLTEDSTASNSHRMFRQVTASLSAVPYRDGICVKNLVGSRNVQLLWGDSTFSIYMSGVFNPTTGAIVSSDGAATGRKLRDGWWRFENVLTGLSDTERWLYVQMMDGGNSTYSGDGTSAIAIWGIDFRQVA